MSRAILHEHLASGLTHVCQCWAITRADGITFGFTDHDRPLQFDGITFAADSGMSAKALASATGLSVNNTEAVGVLNASSITEADIAAGRYDAAQVTLWRVVWDDVAARQVLFRGSIGEITRQGGAFQADLRGLTDALNQPQGRTYLRSCAAVLGDAACRVDLTDPTYMTEAAVNTVRNNQVFSIAPLTTYPDRWFVHGVLRLLDGKGAGLSGVIKKDRATGATRHITLWQPIGADVKSGDLICLTAGCDRRSGTCRVKFDNMLNFQGFPHVPGDDWLVSVPRSDGDNSGGSLS